MNTPAVHNNLLLNRYIHKLTADRLTDCFPKTNFSHLDGNENKRPEKCRKNNIYIIAVKCRKRR